MNKSSILIYQSDSENTKIEVKLDGETVWLNQSQIAELFGKNRRTISEHINNIFKEGELISKVVCRNFQHTTKHGAIKGKTQSSLTKYYSLDLIIAVGYRVRSLQGTKFRQWATTRLSEYIVKGFTMNDDQLKQAGGGVYFDELLARIRDIRTSEKVFWRKVLDIYATSIDYDSKAESSLLFFKTIQNKMHWVSHGSTAAEVIYKRIDAKKPYLGLTTFKGNKPTKKEVEIAKNYLTEKELDILNRLVSTYLDIAEISAIDKKPMYMKDWITKLDEFLKLTGKDILTHSGKISHKQAMNKVDKEYNKYKEQTKGELSSVEHDFIEQLESGVKDVEGKK